MRRALAVAVIVAAAAVGACSSAPTRDEQYLQKVHQIEIPRSDEQLVDLGYLVCSKLDSGLSVIAVAEFLQQHKGIEPDKGSALIEAARPAYCLGGEE